MRHAKSINHLGRTASHRKAMLSNMACSLIMHKRINTTVAKAKALKVYVDPIFTKSKTDSTHSRRVTFSMLNDKYAVTELFRVIAPKIADRPGGYTRILKTGFRQGDNAEMCFIELVDFNELMIAATDSKAKKTTRRGRRTKTAASVAAPVAAEVKNEAEKVEEKVVDQPEVTAEAEITTPEDISNPESEENSEKNTDEN